MEFGFPVASIATQKVESARPVIERSASQDQQGQDLPQNPVVRLTSTRAYSKQEISDQMMSQGNAMVTWDTDVADRATRLYKALDKLDEKVANELPELGKRDWEVSINADNELVVKGEDLSDAQVKKIKEAADGLGIAAKSANFRDSVIKAMEQDRGPFMQTAHLGKYELTKENFHEVVNLRELKADTPVFINTRFNPNPDNVFYHGTSVANALAGQLELRAEAPYQIPSVSEYI